MLDNLTQRLARVVKTVRGHARLSEDNIQDALREVRLALLEAHTKAMSEFLRAEGLGTIEFTPVPAPRTMFLEADRRIAARVTELAAAVNKALAELHRRQASPTSTTPASTIVIDATQTPMKRVVERDAEGRIVAAGARHDLGQHDAALVTVQVPELAQDDLEWGPRLRYAYAEALLLVQRVDDARQWFLKAAAVDPEGLTDAEERASELGDVPRSPDGPVSDPQSAAGDNEVFQVLDLHDD